MNTRQLECFCRIAENRNFSQTANALYVSQSAVTQQINALEKELNFKLFERNTKSVRLTAAGEIFYAYASDALKALNKGISLALDQHQQQELMLRIGCYNVTADRFLTRLLSLFLTRRPDVSPRIEPMRPRQLLPELKAKKLDCCFMVAEDVDFRSDQFDFIPLCKQKLYAVMYRTHPLAKEKVLYPEQLRGYTAKTMTPLQNDFYKTIRVEYEILSALQDDAFPIDLKDGQTELLRLKNSMLVITRPNYTLPRDDSLVFVPLVHTFSPDYGIAVLPEHKRIVSELIRLATSPEASDIFDY